MQAFLLGHTVKRSARAGEAWWTVDDGSERFDSLADATEWIRSQPHWRPECRRVHEPRCSGRRHGRRAGGRRAVVPAGRPLAPVGA